MILRFIIAVILLGLVGGGIVGFNMFRDQAIEQFFANMPVPTVTVSATTVEESSWTPVISTIGTANAARGVELTVQTTGVVREIAFSANQTVAQGDLLIQMDDAMQRADLEAARTQAALDQQSYERALELQQRGVGSAVAVETAQAAAAASASRVASLEAVLEQKQLTAPFGGTIGIPRVDEGQYLAPGTIVATLQDLETMRADFSIPEQQLGMIRMGQPVNVGIGEGDETFSSGEIAGIDPRVDPASRLVSVRARIDNPGNRLTPGQFIQVKVVLPEEKGIIALPQTAIVTSLYGDYVFVVRPKEDEGDEGEEKLEARQVFVTIGRRSGAQAEILRGVSVGDRIVTAGQNRLNNGTPVTIDNTIDPAAMAQTQAAAQ